MNKALDLSHLTPAAQKAASFSNTERIHNIRKERWIGYTRASQALKELEELFMWPPRQRMQNMLIIGPTNNGKSMIIERFCRKYRHYTNHDQSQEIIPVVAVQMPSDPSVKRFYTMLLRAMNSPINRRLIASELEMLTLELMTKIKVKILIIDELHNMLVGDQKVRLEFLNLIRFLGNELRIPIVGVGTGEAYRAIRSDDQLENRFKPFVLPRWKEGNELMSLLASFAASFPLRFPSCLKNEEIARYILSRTEGTIGEISTLLTYAAITAIELGEEAINKKVLSVTNYDSPTERKREFEREVI